MAFGIRDPEGGAGDLAAVLEARTARLVTSALREIFLRKDGNILYSHFRSKDGIRLRGSGICYKWPVRMNPGGCPVHIALYHGNGKCGFLLEDIQG